MVNIPELKVFVAAAEELNFSRAAQRLHLSQSAVSQNIQSIEKNYGVELFVRHGRSVQLSEVGQAILPMAREALSAARLVEDTLSNIHGEVAGELTIGCSTTSGKYLLPNLLAAFRGEYPAVRTRIGVIQRNSVIERLLNQTLALGVISRKAEHRDLECIPLFEDKIILIVPANHPWAKYGRALPADLAEQPFIRREDSSGTCEAVFEELKQFDIGSDDMNIVMELGNAEAIEMAVEEGIGVAFVSELVAARGLALGKVRQVEVEGLNVSQTVYLCRQMAAIFTRAESYFWEFTKNKRKNLSGNLLTNLGDLSHAPDVALK
ncbi:MAG: LysR family transcriptional regulator [Anaerolineales bacterium]